MTYRELARKLTALGCAEIARKGEVASQMAQPRDEPFDHRAGLAWS